MIGTYTIYLHGCNFKDTFIFISALHRECGLTSGTYAKYDIVEWVYVYVFVFLNFVIRDWSP